MQACPLCANSFNPLEGGYDASGAVVCKPCADRARAAVKTQETNAKSSWFVGAIGAFVVSFISFAVESTLVFFLFPLVGIGSGCLIAHGALKNPEVAAALGWKRWPTILIASMAVLLGALSLIVAFAVRE